MIRENSYILAINLFTVNRIIGYQINMNLLQIINTTFSTFLVLV